MFNHKLNQVCLALNRAVAPVAALLVSAVAAPSAMAQATLPAGVSAAIDESGEMLVLGGTAVVVAMVGFWGIRKLGSKMGWW
jgi:hypothetical protein